MKHTLNILMLASSLLLPVTALGQEEDTGVRVNKSVSPRNSDGSYTITLETYATGETEVEMNDVPADIVLVLDLSTSMGGHRGDLLEVTDPNELSLSYNDVVNSGNNYVYWYETHGYGYQISGFKKGNNYYIYWLAPGAGINFLKTNGEIINVRATDYDINLATIPDDPDLATSTNPNEKIVTFAAGIPGKDHPVGIAYDATNPAHENYCHSHLHKASSRLKELENAVCEFIDQINENDLYKTTDDGGVEPRNSRLGNRLAVYTFCVATPTEVQSLQYLTGGDGVTTGNVETLKNSVRAFIMKSGTKPLQAFNKAYDALPVNSNRTRTVVFFTDGQTDAPEDELVEANRIKNRKSATLYSIGMFGSNEAGMEAVQNYMDRVSSNYLNATTINNGDRVSNEYYFDVSSEGNLSQVFTKIAGSIIAESDNPSVEAHTQVRDALSSSFTVPDGFDASKVVVYTVDIDRDGNWYPVPDHTVPAAPNDPTGHVVALTKVTTDDYLTDPTKVKVTTGTDAQGHNTVWVEGFNFVQDDSSLGAGDGNWVGQRYKNGQFFYAGKKLVIEFNIVTIGEATGGDDTSTNTADSGVYIMNPETGEYTSLINYEIPHTNLPINIIIKKKGLRHGQSATFQIETSPFLLDDNGDIVYNDIGKPASKYAQNAEKWDDLTKLIITNKGEDGAEVTKVLRSFEPDRVYRIREDDWGWSYTVIGNNGAVNIPNTSTVEVNPFVFENIENTNAVKHAEAVTINHFSRKGSPGTASVESYKSSKVESFTTPSDSGK